MMIILTIEVVVSKHKQGMIVRLFSVLICLLLASTAQASTVKLNYAVLYGHMKTMHKLNYPDVTTAFYLSDSQKQQTCTIKDAQIVVENKREPILFTQTGRLTPFYSDQYRKDGALLVVDIDDSAQALNCHLQVVVMAKESRLSALNEQKLYKINEQLQGVVKKNAGMVGKHFLPAFAGVRIHFTKSLSNQQLSALSSLVSEIKGQSVLVTPEQFASIAKINELNLSIKRITPWMANQ